MCPVALGGKWPLASHSRLTDWPDGTGPGRKIWTSSGSRQVSAGYYFADQRQPAYQGMSLAQTPPRLP
jgi:hypothetical protein